MPANLFVLRKKKVLRKVYAPTDYGMGIEISGKSTTTAPLGGGEVSQSTVGFTFNLDKLSLRPPALSARSTPRSWTILESQGCSQSRRSAALPLFGIPLLLLPSSSNNRKVQFGILGENLDSIHTVESVWKGLDLDGLVLHRSGRYRKIRNGLRANRDLMALAESGSLSTGVSSTSRITRRAEDHRWIESFDESRMCSSRRSSRSESMKASSSKNTQVMFWRTFRWNLGRLPTGA